MAVRGMSLLPTARSQNIAHDYEERSVPEDHAMGLIPSSAMTMYGDTIPPTPGLSCLDIQASCCGDLPDFYKAGKLALLMGSATHQPSSPGCGGLCCCVLRSPLQLACFLGPLQVQPQAGTTAWYPGRPERGQALSSSLQAGGQVTSLTSLPPTSIMTSVTRRILQRGGQVTSGVGS